LGCTWDVSDDPPGNTLDPAVAAAGTAGET